MTLLLELIERERYSWQFIPYTVTATTTVRYKILCDNVQSDSFLYNVLRKGIICILLRSPTALRLYSYQFIFSYWSYISLTMYWYIKLARYKTKFWSHLMLRCFVRCGKWFLSPWTLEVFLGVLVGMYICVWVFLNPGCEIFYLVSLNLSCLFQLLSLCMASVSSAVVIPYTSIVYASIFLFHTPTQISPLCCSSSILVLQLWFPEDPSFNSHLLLRISNMHTPILIC